MPVNNIENIENIVLNENVIIIVAAVIGVLLTIGFILVVRSLFRSQPAPLPPSEKKPLPVAPIATQVQPTPELEPLTELEARHEARKEMLPPLEIVPAQADEVEAIHTVAEIQRQEPKALAPALANTRNSFFGRLKLIFSKKEKLTRSEMEEIEEILYTSDLGPGTVQRLLSAVEGRLDNQSAGGFEAVREAIRQEMMGIFQALPQNNGTHSDGAVIQIHHGSEDYIEGLQQLNIWGRQPSVLMIVGVNGAGKTTTIGKLARRAAQSGKRVLVAAGDTFRAAAGDQLKVWTERAQVEIFNPEGISDPSAVAFEACQIAKAKNYDLVIIDTAGRLHTQKNLMEELKKMKRVLGKVIPDAPHEVLLVLDANSGQNALVQAKEFNDALGVSGVVLTKLDGTAKGGVAVGLACELHLPIKLIGVGEGIEDLRHFSSQEFVDSII